VLNALRDLENITRDGVDGLPRPLAITHWLDA
jgi:hypothetical protein